MVSPEGGFYSAEDADSEGMEGKFYAWTEDDIRENLAGEDADLAVRLFNIAKPGNFEDEATHRKTGANILHLKKPLSEFTDDLGISEADLNRRFQTMRQKLFSIREKRIHPHKDDKILTDWNGLMIAALAKGSQIFEESGYSQAAKKTADFILDRMRAPEGGLLHRYRNDEAAISGHLDDYAFMIWGLIELYEATFEPRYLKAAMEHNTYMLAHFWDDKNGGFFFTPDNGETLIIRKKEIYDGAMPSGNAVAMHNLLRLSRITADASLDERAARINRAFSEHIRQYPSGHTHFLVSVDYAIGPSYEVVVVGAPEASDTSEMLRSIRNAFIPNRVVIFRTLEKASKEIEEIAPFIKSHVSSDGKATAYVCIGNACCSPTTDIDEMLELLK
jgi:uncharacterized protein YyaL (SSP411 family)